MAAIRFSAFHSAYCSAFPFEFSFSEAELGAFSRAPGEFRLAKPKAPRAVVGFIDSKSVVLICVKYGLELFGFMDGI